MKIKALLFTILFISGSVLKGQAVNGDSLSGKASVLREVRNFFAENELKKGRLLLDSLLTEDSLHIEANYLRAELYILYGDTAYYENMHRLECPEAERELIILKIKEKMLCGDPSALAQAKKALEKYPYDAELQFVIWLYKLDHGGFTAVASSASSLSERIIFRYLPYSALFDYAQDIDPQLALTYLDSVEAIAGNVFHSRNRPLLELLSRMPQKSAGQGEYELEYADCGPGMGFYMTDRAGNRIKVELDTGTSGGLFTIHSDLTGKKLYGKDTLTIPDGIWYNYMEGPADMHYKISSFNEPPMDNFLTGYFEGSFSKADGCFSPFVFRPYALSIDPVRRKAFLRDEDALERYLESLDNYTAVEYHLRGGWIYIPCRVNGKERLMMIETGSRYITLNAIAAKNAGVLPYEGTIQWRGEDYPVKKIDFTLEIGNIRHEVKGGMISSFVMGNTYYGLASAGDIGPDFLRNYAFTIDPFKGRFIIEERHKEPGN